MKEKIYKIGTRASPLALWQAKEVQRLLKNTGISTELVPLTSLGDKNLIQPLYEMNIIGVFTKELDTALLNNQIDIAVHSLKDVPTTLPQNLEISAVLERDYYQDILIRNPNSTRIGYENLTLLTGSLRRQAFWQAKYPQVSFGGIRGNVQTRLQKLKESTFDGTIFSLAGIKRMNLDIPYEVLDFMIPAPAQGVVACVSRSEDLELNQFLKQITHLPTEKCVTEERKFLAVLEGGCSAPIGAIAKIDQNTIHFKGQLSSVDGSKTIICEENKTVKEFNATDMARELLLKGGKDILMEIKNK